MGFWTAWQFMTIIPAPRNSGIGVEGIRHSIAYFPLVGLILGAMLLGIDQLFDLYLPDLVVAALILIGLVILTGALHLDGFMDTCDGFAVKTSAEDRLRIMADSRVGGFGVAGACCLLLLKYVCILSLPEDLRGAALLLMPALGRWSAAFAIIMFPSARKLGVGRMYKEQAGIPMLTIAAVFVIAIAVGLISYSGAALVIAVTTLSWVIGRVLSRRLGGLTGDTYGAIIELVEVSVLVGIIIIGKAGGTSWLGSYL